MRKNFTPEQMLHTVRQAESGTPVAEVCRVLDRLKLTALMPLLALFLVSVLIYGVDRIVFVVAALFPIDVTYSNAALFGMHRQLSHVWRWCPEIEDTSQLLAVIRGNDHKSRVEGKEIVL